MPVKVIISDSQRDLSISKLSVRAVAKELLFLEKRATDELSISFVTEKRISELHEQFFRDPTPTDCITFPIDSEPKEEPYYHVLGEIFISPKAALNFVGERREQEGKEKIYVETTLYLVHGLLHLLGYDDLAPKERRRMRFLERKYMSHLLDRNLILKPLKKTRKILTM